MPDRLVLFIYESWKNLDGSVEGLNREEATTQHGGGSSIAWTIGHVTNMVDSWINVNFQGLAPSSIHQRTSVPRWWNGRVLRLGRSSSDYP